MIIEIMESYLLINYDVLESDYREDLKGRILKLKVRRAFEQKLKVMDEYIDEMMATAAGQTPAECGLDPAFNINEFLKDLDSLF